MRGFKRVKRCTNIKKITISLENVIKDKKKFVENVEKETNEIQKQCDKLFSEIDPLGVEVLH